jgi:hypothetical protein
VGSFCTLLKLEARLIATPAAAAGIAPTAGIATAAMSATIPAAMPAMMTVPAAAAMTVTVMTAVPAVSVMVIAVVIVVVVVARKEIWIRAGEKIIVRRIVSVPQPVAAAVFPAVITDNRLNDGIH